jgi:hypothetical protein
MGQPPALHIPGVLHRRLWQVEAGRAGQEAVVALRLAGGGHHRLAAAVQAMKYYFKAYATDHKLRDIIETKRLTDLNVYPAFGMSDFKAVPSVWRDRIPEYVKDYVPLNQFM